VAANVRGRKSSTRKLYRSEAPRLTDIRLINSAIRAKMTVATCTTLDRMLFPVRLRILLGLLMPPLLLRAVINSAIDHGVNPLVVITGLDAVGVVLVASC